VTRFGVLLLAAGLVLAVSIAFRRRRETVTMPPQAVRRSAADDDIDWDELERAEREVRDLDHDGSGEPPEQAKGEDWGPGTPKPPMLG
jgi:hypothetical protein